MKKNTFFIIVLVAVSVSLTGADCSWIRKTSDDSKEQMAKTASEPVGDADKKKIDEWITSNDLNEFGDPKDTVYAGGTPLFNEQTGETTDRYVYLLTKHPELVPQLQLDYLLK